MIYKIIRLCEPVSQPARMSDVSIPDFVFSSKRLKFLAQLANMSTCSDIQEMPPVFNIYTDHSAESCTVSIVQTEFSYDDIVLIIISVFHYILIYYLIIQESTGGGTVVEKFIITAILALLRF